MSYHVFQYGGVNCVIDIEKMQAKAVDDLTAEALKKIPSMQERPLPSDLEENPKKKKQEPLPINSMALFVTQACNLRCT